MERQNNNWQCPICGRKKAYPDHDFCQGCNVIYNEDVYEIRSNGESFPSRREWKIDVLEHPGIRIQVVLRQLEITQKTCWFLAEKAAKIIEAANIEFSRELATASVD